MKRIQIIIAILLCFSTAWAYDFSAVYNGTTFYFNITSNTAPYTIEVTHNGYSNIYSGNVTIPSSVSYSGRTYSVTKIGQNSFYRCTNLTSVTIPNTVTIIGQGAFQYCSGWTTVTIPNSVTNIEASAFFDNRSLISVTIGNSVTSIGNDAFGHTGLTSVTIPSSVNHIGLAAFGNCPNLSVINVANGNTHYSSNNGVLFSYNQDTIWCYPAGKSDNYTIPNSVTSIGTWAFINDTSLISITIPNSVTNIGDFAFVGCTGLTSVTIPNSVTSIGNRVFSACTGLTSVTIRRANTTIGNNAFINVSTSIPVYVPCGSSAWYRNQMSSFSYFVEFFPYTYSAVSCNNAIGVVTTDTAPTCNNNSVWTIRASANHGFVFSRWSDSVSTNPRTITVTKDTNLTAIFDTISYNVVAVSDDTTKGVVSGGGSYNYLRTATLTATANHGFAFSRWSDSVSTNPRTITVTQDTNLTAIFDTISYNVVAVSEDTTKGFVSGGGTYLYMHNAVITATANSGYSFSHWSDGDTNVLRTLTITQDTSLVAYFTATTPPWYTFSVVSEDTNKGTVQVLVQPTQSSPQATFVALPNNGYTFTHWSDGNTQNPRSLTVTQDTALVAYFRWYDFIVSSEDTAKGTVQVLTQPSQSNPQATFVALPNTGYTFSRWSDGNTQNPRSITVTHDTILIAFFTSTQGIAEAENASITIYPNPASDKVTLEGIGNEADIFIINSMGKVVRRLENAGGTITFSVGDLPKGIYFVRVGNAVRKLVVDSLVFPKKINK